MYYKREQTIEVRKWDGTLACAKELEAWCGSRHNGFLFTFDGTEDGNITAYLQSEFGRRIKLTEGELLSKKYMGTFVPVDAGWLEQQGFKPVGLE